MNQPALFRPTDPSTSSEAARSLTDYGREACETAVLLELRSLGLLRVIDNGLQGGRTDEEMVAILGDRWSPSGIRTRRKELVVKGLVEDSGFRRLTRSGRNAVVWMAV